MSHNKGWQSFFTDIARKVLEESQNIWTEQNWADLSTTYLSFYVFAYGVYIYIIIIFFLFVACYLLLLFTSNICIQL